jgi:hypothetical protein
MKPWLNTIKQSTHQKGKKGTKKKDSSFKDKTQNGSPRGKGTNHVSKSSLITTSGMKHIYYK